jgi:hypothetical protein
VSETSNDSPTVTTTGNSIDGDQTITTTGDRIYSVTEDTTSSTNNGSSGGGLLGGLNVTHDYGFTETGSNPYTRTEVDNANDGSQSTTESGTDSYTLSGYNDLGTLAADLSISGTDTYTIAGLLNTQTGGFTLTTSGSGTSTAGDTSFTSTESGDTRDGSVTLSNTGTNRYDLLGGFNNTADGANGDIGMADFSPVGMPIYVSRSSTPSGMFSSVGDDQFEYCFAKGTLVLTSDGAHKAIEKIEPGTIVLAVSQNDPEAVPTDCIVREIYHNAPAEILNISIPSDVDPLNDDVIRTTAGHPFYVREKGWIKAGELITGDQLRTSDGGWTKVRAVSYSGTVEPVFNLRVDGAHTYFVSPSAGSASVLVHNASAGMGLHNFPKGIDPTTLGQCLAISGKVFGTGLAAIPVAMALPEVLGGTAIDTGLAAAGRLAVASTRVVQAAAPYVSAYVAAKLATDQKAQDAFLSAGGNPAEAIDAIFGDLAPATGENTTAENLVTWIDEGGNLRVGGNPGMSSNAYIFQSATAGARSSLLTGRSQAPYLSFTDESGNIIGAKFDGAQGMELIDAKLNPYFSAKAVDEATRQAAVARYYDLQAVWEFPTQAAASAGNRFMQVNNITGITVRVRP